MNSLVLSDEQRAATTDPITRQLLELIPRANYFDSDGTPRFIGSAAAVVDMNTATVDIRQNIGARDRFQMFLGRQQLQAIEPTSQGMTIPGFGHVRPNVRHILTVNQTHLFESGLLNEARFGRSSQDGNTLPATELNPATFGIGNGIDRPIGLPQIVVAGGLNFGGPAILPQGRNDTLYIVPIRSPTRPPGTSFVSAASTGDFSATTSMKAQGCSTSRAWRRSWPEPPTRSASHWASGGATSHRTPLHSSFRTNSHSGPT